MFAVNEVTARNLIVEVSLTGTGDDLDAIDAIENEFGTSFGDFREMQTIPGGAIVIYDKFE